MTQDEHDFEFAFEDQEYRIDLMLVECEALQKATHAEDMVEFTERLRRQDARCIRALVWVARKRTEPRLRLEDVDGPLTSFTAIPGDDEDEDEQAASEEPGKAPTTTGGPSTTVE